VRLLVNPHRRDGYGETENAVMQAAEADTAAAEIRSWPDYAPTPLIPLPALARRMGVAALTVKHEGRRFAVGSFKALGPPYAAIQVMKAELARHGAADARTADILSGRHAGLAHSFTFTAATSGNHGRAVAWAAQRFGAMSRIYMHAGVSPGRAAAIASFGATVVRVPGTFDDALNRCLADATGDSTFVIADQPHARAPDVPRLTIHGYGVLGMELAVNAHDATHVFVGAGNGSLAAAITARLWLTLGRKRPRVVTVEPLTADGALRAATEGRPVPVPGDLATVMDGLAVGTVSPLAWPVLAGGAHAFLAIPDTAAIAGLRMAAAGDEGDPALAIGETGIAGLAGALTVLGDRALRRQLGVTANSRIVAVACEGATDPAVYRGLVGRDAEHVEPRGAAS